MEFRSEDVLQLAGTIWEAVLELPVEGVDAPVSGPAVSARVDISGTWEGSVLLECALESARIAASVMFAASPESVTEAELRDAVAELANMVGGNLKGLLPEHCQLSIPVQVNDPRAEFAAGGLITRVGFESLGAVSAVSVFDRAAVAV